MRPSTALRARLGSAPSDRNEASIARRRDCRAAYAATTIAVPAATTMTTPSMTAKESQPRDGARRDLLANGKRRRGGGRGGVEHVDHALTLGDGEIVDQGAVARDRLGAHPG